MNPVNIAFSKNMIHADTGKKTERKILIPPFGGSSPPAPASNSFLASVSGSPQLSRIITVHNVTISRISGIVQFFGRRQ